MNRPEKTRRILPRAAAKYALLQVPALLLVIAALFYPQNILHIPVPLKWLIVLLWVAKDTIMFPFVWRSYDAAGFDLINTMKGKKGVALEHIDPEGYILVNGERWKARNAYGPCPLKKGTPVEVLEMKGLCLYVRAFSVHGKE